MYILACTLSLVRFSLLNTLFNIAEASIWPVLSCAKAAGDKSREREHSLQKADWSQTNFSQKNTSDFILISML